MVVVHNWGDKKLKFTLMKIQDAKILVIDDDNVMRMFVSNLLGRMGVREVREANDGQIGLAMVASFKPDIILTDIHMAPMNGLEFVKRLRALNAIGLRKIPVLIMSADSSSQTLNESVPLGIAGYIIKPPVMSSLTVKLEHALKFRLVEQSAAAMAN